MGRRIDKKKRDAMFKKAGVTRSKLHDALRKMGPQHVKSHLRKDWSPENPTRQYCYVVAEYVFNYLAPKGSVAMKVPIPGDDEQHRYVMWNDGTIVDLTAEQFPDYSVVDYTKGKKFHFMHPSPSRRARILAGLMGSHAPRSLELKADYQNRP